MSEIAYVPPYLPDIAFNPIVLVDSTHFVGDIVKAFNPASFLNPSNSMGLKKTESCLISHGKLPNFHKKVGNFLKIVIRKFGGTDNFQYICSTTISHIYRSTGSDAKERDSLRL